MDYLFPYVQHLIIELSSYVILEVMGFNTGRCFVTIWDIKSEIVS